MNINEILFIIILFIFYLCLVKYKKKNNKEILSDNKIPSIIFDYNNLPYKSHKELGFNNGIIYHNSWIENIDPITNKPIYKSRYQNKNENDIEIETTNNYIEKMDNNGKTLKEIYDSSFVNYKNQIPVKNVINNINESSINGASNLSILLPDMWIYENENPENGGLIKDGLYAYDDELLQQNAKF
jgi:hypothetical protein